MSMRNSGSLLISIYLIAATLSGCNRQPVHLDSQFSTNSLHRDSETTNSFRLLSIKDARRNKKSLGRVSRRNVENEYVLTWLTQGLETIGITPIDSKEINQNGIEVDVSLIMLYARSVEANICCDVVLKVKFSKDGNELKQTIYRGNDIRLNWVSGKGEIDACFDRALAEALESIQADMITIK